MNVEEHFPNLFLLGVQKAGTTMLYDLFKGHPSIFLPENKEPHYFSCNEYYDKGLGYYLNYYKRARNQKYLADFTPDYLFWPLAFERMAKFITEETKFIVSLRQPATRAYSQYNMMVSRGFNMNGFENDLSNEVVDLQSPEQTNLLRPSHMIARGQYSVQLERLFNLVPKKQIKIIIFEEWVKKRGETIQELEEFLDIPHSKNDISQNSISNPTLIYPSNSLVKHLKNLNTWILKSSISQNKLLLKAKEQFKGQIGKKPEKLSMLKLKEITEMYFLEDIKKCEQLLNRDLSLWY